jgi:nitrate reductase NapAB chaperone NapD
MRLTTDSQAILDRLDSVEESYLADRLAINQRIDNLEKTLTTLARQQELLNSYPCNQPELDEHLAKIDSYLSSYEAREARVDELSDSLAQLERMSVTLSQQNGENLAQFNSSMQEQIFQLLMELETVKNAIAPSPISSATAQEAIVPSGQHEAIASQESLPLSPDQSEPTLIGEHSLLSIASSPTKPSANLSESAGDWLTLGEAYKIAKANGYEGSIHIFRTRTTRQEDYNQVYAQYGLKADLKRRGKRGKPSKYFCRLSQFQSNM